MREETRVTDPFYTPSRGVTVTAWRGEDEQSNFLSVPPTSFHCFCLWRGDFMEVCGEVAEGSWIYARPYGPRWLSKCHGLSWKCTMTARKSAQ